MATIQNSATLTIADAPTEQITTNVLVLPIAGVGEGRGRLIHPTLGTYDYLHAPDEWSNIDGDVIVPPIWQSSMTLDGGQNTLWPGHIRDVECSERWTSPISMPMAMLRQLLAFWVAPPDPASAHIQWYPSYTTALGYDVIITAVTVGGREVTLNYISRQDRVNGAVEVKYRVVGYAS